MRLFINRGTATAILATALCGCINSNETIYHNPERVKVEFENERAAHLFYEALSKTGTVSRHESDTTVQIPVVFENHRRVVDGENVAFNDAVRQCDTNQDGKVTELEAKIFSERFQKK